MVKNIVNKNNTNNTNINSSSISNSEFLSKNNQNINKSSLPFSEVNQKKNKDEKNIMNLNNRFDPFPRNYKKNIEELEESHKQIDKYMRKLDEEFKKRTFDISYKDYVTVLKDKKYKTKYAYMIVLSSKIKNQLPMLLNLAYSIKYKYKSKYDLVCLVQNKSYYEKNKLNNYYKKYEGLEDSEINDIIKIFDVVLIIDSSNLLKKYLKKKILINDDSFTLVDYRINIIMFGYTEYEKIMFCSNRININENIDYIFDKYNKSTYSNYYFYKDYSGGLARVIILIEPRQYYIPKIFYIINNYNNIFKKLKFNHISISPKLALVYYYTIYPNWNNESFDKNLINYNLEIDCNINLYKKYDNYFDIESYVYIEPECKKFFYQKNKFINLKEFSKFNLNLINFNNWDLSVKELLKDFPEFSIYFDYIKTYRYTLF